MLRPLLYFSTWIISIPTGWKPLQNIKTIKHVKRWSDWNSLLYKQTGLCSHPTQQKDICERGSGFCSGFQIRFTDHRGSVDKGQQKDLTSLITWYKMKLCLVKPTFKLHFNPLSCCHTIYILYLSRKKTHWG